MFGYHQENGVVYGTMPDGTEDEFKDVNQYEDAYVDALFELENFFEIEYDEIA